MKRFPGKYPHFMIKPLTTTDDIKPLLEARIPGYQKADYLIQGAGKSTATLAKQIIEILDL